MLTKTLHLSIAMSTFVLLFSPYAKADNPCAGLCACEKNQEGETQYCNSEEPVCNGASSVYGTYKCVNQLWIGQKDSNSVGKCPCG